MKTIAQVLLVTICYVFSGNFAGATSAPFTFTSADLASANPSFLDWGDYDRDGLLDLLVIGQAVGESSQQPPTIAIYHNLGSRTFTNISAGLVPMFEGGASWGDFDNDGWLDIGVNGRVAGNPGTVSRIYRNKRDGTFEDSGAGLPVGGGAVAWADIDNNGTLDLVIGNRVLRNDRFGEFTEVHVLNSVSPNVMLADFDNDGWNDILANGYFSQNNKNGTFSNVSQFLTGIPPGYVSSAGDFNEDARLDVIVSSSTHTGSVTRLYLNRSTLAFAPASAPLAAGGIPVVADYDNDGRTDLFLTATSRSNSINVALLRNTGETNFTLVDAGNPPLGSARAAWADIDGDGRLDISVIGSRNLYFPGSAVGWNVAAPSNTPPQSPTDLIAIVTNDTVLMQWSPGQDAETPPRALSYNIRIGTAPGGDDVLSSHALPNGRRLLARHGNVGFTNRYFLRKLPMTGTYYWTVQTVDAVFSGSEFADEQTFTAAVPPLVRTLAATDVGFNEATLKASVTANGFDAAAWFEWGETTNYGNSTIPRLLSGGQSNVLISMTVTNAQRNTLYHYRAVASNSIGIGHGLNRFFKTSNWISPASVQFPALWTGSAEWADYNNDGWLDLILTGGANGNSSFTGLFRNNGDSTFSLVTSGLPTLGRSSAAWADYNNDGWLDLLLTAQGFVRIYRNNSDGTFTDIQAGFPQEQTRQPAFWGDFDNDGWQDLLLNWVVFRNLGNGQFERLESGIPWVAGFGATGDCDQDGNQDVLMTGAVGADPGISRIYRNTGNGTFVAWQTNFPSFSYIGSMGSFADVNNDGWLDVLFTGSTNGAASGAVTWLATNDGSGVLVKSSGFLPHLWTLAHCWGDFDNDGWADVFLSGVTVSDQVILRIYLNATGQTFSPVDLGLPAVRDTAIAWGDFDNDTRLDLLFYGRSAGMLAGITTLYRNTYAPTNSVPSPPQNLRASESNGIVTFQWDPAVDDTTPSRALTYNVRVGTAPHLGDIVSPLSATGGFRRVPKSGNVGSALVWKLRSLPRGTYFWSVQAVDASFAGSSFAPEGSFVVGTPRINSASFVNGNSFALRFFGHAGTVYNISASSNLVNWFGVGTARPTNSGPYQFTDTTNTNRPARFYRLIIP